MPIYEYRCNNGHNFEAIQSMSDDPVTACQECGAPVERVFHPIAVHFKGSGFYTTDYARKGAGQTSAEGGASKSDSDSGPGSDSSGSKSDSGSSKPEKAAKSSEGSKSGSSSD
jgi:putative FmdB family regulatory protein